MIKNPFQWATLSGLAFLITVGATAQAVAKFYPTNQPNCEIEWGSTSLIESIIWSGDCKDGRADGFGSVQYNFVDSKTNARKDMLYIGDFLAGQRHGRGIASYSNDEVYDGDWQNNKRTGTGEYRWADGSESKGEWRDDKRNGKGTYINAKTGNRYIGNYVNDKFHGEGTYEWAETGNRYVGEYKNGDRTGQGTYHYKKSGNRYEGEFLDGKRHGYGTFYSAKGDIKEHAGMWANDLREGRAELQYKKQAEGVRIEAEFSKDVMHGTMVAHYPDGSRWEIQFKEGKGVSQKKYAADGSLIPDFATVANAAIDEFKFPKDTCGSPQLPWSLGLEPTKAQVDRINAVNNRWRDCNYQAYFSNRDLVRKLVTEKLGGTWESNPDKTYTWSVHPACKCFERVNYLLDLINKSSELYTVANKELDAATNQHNEEIAQYSASRRQPQARVYNEVEQTLNTLNTMRYQNNNNVWGGYSGPTYRSSPYEGFGQILGGQR